MFHAYKRYARHLPIYVFFKSHYFALIYYNYVGMLPNLKSRNYDGIRQSATKWSSQMSPLFIVGARGPSHGYIITNAFHKNDLMVVSYPCNEGGMLDMCAIGATSHEVG